MKNFNLKKTLVPLIAILFGFILGALIMLGFGYNPLWGYEDLLTAAFGTTKAIGEIFRSMGPLILTALPLSSLILYPIWSALFPMFSIELFISFIEFFSTRISV